VAEEDWREREKEKTELNRLIKIDELTEEAEISEVRKKQYGSFALVSVLTFFSFIFMFDEILNIPPTTNLVADILVMAGLCSGILFGILHTKESSRHKKLIARIKLERKTRTKLN
jgi:hypothetical protein